MVAWRQLCIAVLSLVMAACTSSPSGSPEQSARPPRPFVEATPLPTFRAVPGRPARPSDSPAAAPNPCRVTRGADLDLDGTWRRPEAAIAAVAGRPAHAYDAAVRVGTIDFFPRDRSRSYRVESVENGWTVASWSAPGCRPRVLALAGVGDADPRQLACDNPQSRIYNRSYDQPSVLDAVHAELAGDYANRLPQGRYADIGRDRGRTVFGSFGPGGLVAALWVLHGKSGFGVEAVTWC